MANGTGTCLSTVSTAADFSQESIDTLLFMIEEEKMARDLYTKLYKKSDLDIFNTIAQSEDRHMDALILQAENIGLDVGAITSKRVGKFENDAIQDLYNTLLKQGKASPEAALNVGVLVEETDIADLEVAIVSVVGTSLEAAYSNLLYGSNNHLDSFSTWLASY
jgi:hypothetical protein